MPMQPLHDDVIAQIKSSTTITSLNGVILELLKNSLDAGSTKVDISVDYGRGGCVVEDNGFGILPSEFGANGGLGKLYRESIEERSVGKANIR
jgi:DNA mismatch repair protein MLH3